MSRLIEIPFELPDQRSQRIADQLGYAARSDERIGEGIITSRALAERATKRMRERGMADVTVDEVVAVMESCPDLPEGAEEPERWDGLS